MSLVARQIPALYNGVSQQPATTRLPSQAEAQVNGWSSVVDGLKKRPPTEHLALLTASDLTGAYTHIVNRDENERYIVVLLDGAVKVFDLDGVEKTVVIPGRQAWEASNSYPEVGITRAPTTPNGFLYRISAAGTSGATEPTWPVTLGDTVVDGTVTWQCVPDYLKVTDPQAEFSAVSVADYTFIVNKSVYTAMAAVGNDEYTPSASLFSITDTMKKKQANALLAQQSTRDAAVRAQYAANSTGNLFRGIKQSIEDIPLTPAPVEGDVWQIQGTADSGFATYFVRRTGAVWDECVAPNLSNRILECTMPHALVRLANGTFEFQAFTWAPRRVGDETTNPNPSFIGRQIQDVFFYKNRLGFVCDENAILSRAGDFGNFYRLTVVDLLDDETIDVAASTTQVTKFNYGVPFNSALMLFSGQVQFVLSDSGALTPGSVSLDVATSYRMAPNVRPEALGSDLYFVAEGGDYARVMEYYVREQDNSTDASDVTAHVPRYIPAGVYALWGSPDLDLLCTVTSGHPNRIYTYKFYWTSGSDKAQSAWSYWELMPDDVILDGAIIDKAMYLVVKRPTGTFLERCNLESGAQITSLGMQIYLDRRFDTTGVYLSGEGVTEWSIPYVPEVADRARLRIVQGAAMAAPGGTVTVDPLDYTWFDAQTVRVSGNYAGAAHLGFSYTFSYTFSEQFMSNAADVPVTSGRLQLRTWTIYYTDTAYFETSVAPYGNDPDIEQVSPAKFATFEGKTVGDVELLNSPVFADGAYPFQVYGASTSAVVSLLNDSPYASNFQAAEWEGFYQNRISRLV